MSQALRWLGISWLALSVAACAPLDGSDPDVDDAEESEDALDEAVSDSWSDGPGFGIRFRRANENADVAIFYGGYGATLAASQSWADETFAEDLEARGFGVLYAVKGPLHADYRDWEIGNSKIAKRLIGEEGAKATRILVIAHSSGAFVAHELFTQLADGRDVDGVTAGKITYFNLDGAGGPPGKALQRLSAAWAVSVRDANGVRSMNASTADLNASNYAAAGKGGLHELSAAPGVCASGAKWCLHMVTTNERPHNKWGLDVARDYTDFEGHPVQLGFLSRLTD
ncbi:MAG: hypothetical protein JNK04_20465 [Myxococcales bacterium]|nr:hypothetical protein [Myxococcales bacterium]